MIKDIKSYFRTIASRLFNAFDVQDFDIEDESTFWRTAAEQLSAGKTVAFKDIALWMDRLYQAPAHFVYVKKDNELVLFRRHLIAENLEYSFDDQTATKDNRQAIRDFEERFDNLQPVKKFSDKFRKPGLASFSVGSSQYIPLFKGDHFVGIYCAGPYVKMPETVASSVSTISNILGLWISEKYDKQDELQHRAANSRGTEAGIGDIREVSLSNISNFLIRYLIKLTGSESGLLVKEGTVLSVIDEVNFPPGLKLIIESAAMASPVPLDLKEWLENNQQQMETHGFLRAEGVKIKEGKERITLYFFHKTAAGTPHTSVDIKQKVQQVLRSLLQFKIQNTSFVEQIMQMYYLMVRELEKQKVKTHAHTDRVIAFSEHFAKDFLRDESERTSLVQTAMLHDIGYVGLSDMSVGSDLEHPVVGKMMLEGLMLPREVLRGIATHHEWVNGSGSPLGLTEEDIPLNGKIVAIFEFVVQFIEDNINDDSLKGDEWMEKLMEELRTRADKQFDKVLADKVNIMLQNMDWPAVCRLGVSP